jgi:hypothetical protein
MHADDMIIAQRLSLDRVVWESASAQGMGEALDLTPTQIHAG